MECAVKRILTTGLLLMLCACGLGCGTREAAVAGPEANKLLIIGIDSADWALIQPLMDEGKLPHLRDFMAQSARGRMKTFYPLEKSPVLWASICTGVRPEVHGILHFVEGAEQKPVRGSAWYAPALWDIAGAAKLTTAVIGMWVTYPARPISGVMVSDYLTYSSKRPRPLEGLVTPDSLANRIYACRVDPDSIGYDQLARFIVSEDLPKLAAKYPFHFNELREVLASDLSYLNAARLLAAERDFDIFFFYLRGPDLISHHFFDMLVPERSHNLRQPDELAAFGQVVPRYYQWADEAVGEVLSWFPPTRQAVIVSDHGFAGPAADGTKGTAEHSEWGIFMVRSPNYQAGYDFGHLELLDICPTLLSLVGLPPAADMPGSILAGGLDKAGRRRVERMEKHRVATYLPLRPAEGPAGEQDDAVDEEIRRQLRSLGYIK
jgi:predicted AlkP superfamily phosphohydrolase/phosphomutase